MRESKCLLKAHLTIVIFLPWVGDQPAVVRARGQEVRNAIIIIILITLITQPVLICVQLGAVNNGGAIVCAVLVPITIAASTETKKKWYASISSCLCTGNSTDT